MFYLVRLVKKFTLSSNFILAVYARVPCHPALCKWQANGSTFRISDDHPGQFVQCSNKIAYCFDCPANLVFDNHQNVCVFRHDAKKPIKHLDYKFLKGLHTFTT